MGTGTEDYYHHWAPGYDEVYTSLERQSDMPALRARLTDWFAGKRVLKVAAGTGWWTSVLADTAASVTATDVVCAIQPNRGTNASVECDTGRGVR
jgi:protein-L-isoaspartate O-methyltransferase